jgi:hypothetical protein
VREELQKEIKEKCLNLQDKASKIYEDPKINRKSLRDKVEVFLYDNLYKMISPEPLIVLKPGDRMALVDELNWLEGGYGFPKDIQEILNNYILTHIEQISISPAMDKQQGGTIAEMGKS